METADIWIGIIVPIIIGPICAYLMTLRNDYVERNYRRKREKYEEERNAIYNSIKNFYWPVYLNLIYIEQYSYSIPIKNKFRYESGSSVDISDNSSDFFEDNENKSQEKLNSNLNVVEIDLDSIDKNDNVEIKSDSSSDNYEISIDMPSLKENDNSQNLKMTIQDQPKHSRRNSKKYETHRKKTIILDKKTLNYFEENLNKKYSEIIYTIEENMVLVCIHQDLNMEIIKFMKYSKVREIIQEGSPDREYNIEYFGVENNLRELTKIIKLILDQQNEKYIKLINNPI